MLAILTILFRFVGSPLGKLAAWLLGALIGTGLLLGIYRGWEHEVRQAALADYNKRQLEQVAKEQAEQIKKIENLNQAQEQITQTLNQQNAESTATFDNINRFIQKAPSEKENAEVVRPPVLVRRHHTPMKQTPNAKPGNRPVSEVVKHTIRQWGRHK